MTDPALPRQCRMCHRRLRDPASRAAGIGPVCHRKLRPTRGTPTPEQLTLDEEPHGPEHTQPS
ncbi:DUF6011 domain-containing protein [Streptomyces albipurpureus]|uniref:DUF6011 domain-containing protein n=1 Tax=Streptomyces albipurpureus TaxID=2897419 RepID=A0ABT0V2E1_9ACTN|nr:DUF6011 domain-containing protein [Streptomyces sp. CWNU-1]MCM2394374.1 DUF6011 domain-containing protein [Streptomyces sp. CWNU-1]